MRFLIFTGVFLFSLKTTPENLSKLFILWDVGQGQWVTAVNGTTCDHFDAGGESFPSDVLRVCGGLKNRLSISHWDKDHTSMIWRARKSGLDFCIADLPRSAPPRPLKGILQWRKCERIDQTSVEVFRPPKISKHQNDNSLAFLVEKKIAIPGDLPGRLEQEIRFDSSLASVQILIAGHHGSRTSSHPKWLARLPNLNQVLVSARREKYGHPHPIVAARFRRMRVPLLSTEDWGSFKVVTPSELRALH